MFSPLGPDILIGGETTSTLAFYLDCLASSSEARGEGNKHLGSSLGFRNETIRRIHLSLKAEQGEGRNGFPLEYSVLLEGDDGVPMHPEG